ncbi:hypothetical protein ACTQ5J_01110 [Fundicoccus sp. Sow4_F4]|uniref:hypothetical protein n=1 Tax=Fundicoccus sp. Sow4_F4 TaxID=3438783 RepID=UPI003F9019AC
MASKFQWVEILLFITPVVVVYMSHKYFRSYLNYFKGWPLSLAIILLPLWLVMIHEFGWLIFDYNLVPYILFITAFMLGCQLYDFVRRVDEFFYRDYYRPAGQLVFMSFSSFLTGLIILRFITYFI